MGNIQVLEKTDDSQNMFQFGFDNFLDYSIRIRQEIFKKEINDIINQADRVSFVKYIEKNFLDLSELDKLQNPETYEICAKSFNYILRQFIENETYKGYLLSGKRGSDMYILREEIVTFIPEFIDNDIIELLLSNLEKKLIVKEEKKVEINPIEQEQEQQHIIEDIYDPDNVDAYF